MLEIEYRRSKQIQTTITFYTDFLLGPVIYRDARNWMLKLWANPNDKSFYSDVWLSPVLYREARNWMLSSEKIQTTITFYSDVWLSPVIYTDARNWMLKFWAKSNDNNFLLGCLIESRNISRRSKLNTEALGKFKRQLIFTQMSDWVP